MLAEFGNKTVILEMLPMVGKGIYINNVIKTTMRLKEKGVEIKTNHKLEAIKENTVVVKNSAQNITSEIECDGVVMAIGVIPENSLLPQLEGRFKRVINVGDSSRVGKLATAVRDGYDYLKNV